MEPNNAKDTNKLTIMIWQRDWRKDWGDRRKGDRIGKGEMVKFPKITHSYSDKIFMFLSPLSVKLNFKVTNFMISSEIIYNNIESLGHKTSNVKM